MAGPILSGAADGRWNVNADGSWNAAGSWVGGIIPNGAGDLADLRFNITATRTVTLNIDPTVGTLILGDTNNSNAFVLTGGTLTFDNGGLINNDGLVSVTGALLEHNASFAPSGGFSPSGSDRIDSMVSVTDIVGLTINTGDVASASSSTRNIEFRGAWTGNGTNKIDLIGDGRVYWNANTFSGTLSNVASLNILNGEALFGGVAGTLNSNLIGAATINLGDGFVTANATSKRAFPRLHLQNTETTQTAALNINGGWLTSDLGNNDNQVVWSNTITITGLAATNLIDVNDAGAADTHIITGAITGTGGFSKINAGTLELQADNDLLGNIYIQRAGAGGASITSEGGIQLTTATGAFSGANSIVLSRDGSLYLDNSVTILDEGVDGVGRVGNDTDLELRAAGRLRLIGNSAAAVSEDLGALLQATGSGKVNFDLDDTTPQLTTLTFDSYTRAAGSITQFQVLDNTPGAFGSQLGGNARLFIADSGATAVLKGGGGADLSTNKTIVVGAFGGVNNISNHFMTFDDDFATELRPLTWDGTQAGSEYWLSRDNTAAGAHAITLANLGSLDRNVNLNYNVSVDGDVDWYAIRPVNIQENLAMNSLRFGTNTPTSGTNTQNTNEIASALVLKAGVHVYLGDSLAANTGLSGDTDGSGMILFGRDVDGTNPGSNQYIAGGVLDFGSREAIIVNESGNSAYIRSAIQSSGGLTKAGANTVYLDNSNTYTGDTNVAEGILVLRDKNALGDSTVVNLQGDGRLYLELGTNVINSATTATPPNLFIGINSVSTSVLYSNGQNNTWGGDVIVDTVDNTGNWVFTPRIGTNSLATLNINGDIYSNEVLNPINTDIALNDARLVSTEGTHLNGGIINLNGQFRDSSAGGINAVVTSDNENKLLRFLMRGSNELVVNVRQQWDSAGRIMIENGILRYEGDGNFFTAAAAFTNTANAQSGIDMSGSGSGTGISGNNNNTANTALILTKAGQVLNIGRIDIGGDGTNNFNGLGNVTLAGTNTSGTVTFGDGTERVVYNGSNSTNAFRRDLSAYQAGGGTMELNFRLDDTDVDSLTSFTKIGRGVVNYNSAGTTDGDVEIIYTSGGLLRLTNYGVATGRRFDSGAKLVLAGGGIEMDTTSAIAAEVANYTAAALTGYTGPGEVLETLVTAGGTDVIVTAGAFNATMNIGSATVPLTRERGGTVNFVENVTGAGSASITLQGNAGQIQANDTAYAWATYGDSYTFNAGAASYTLNALDFASTTGAGLIGAFAGPTREENSLVSTWATAGNDLSENGAGFDGSAIIAALPVNTIHFDFDGAGSIDATNGLEVTSGGIMIASGVLTSVKSILNGTLNAGVDADLIIHHYGGADMTISSVIQDNAGSTPGTGNALVKTGSGNLILQGINTYTGGTYLNGGQLTISSNTNLGATPGSADADNIHANGGILRVVSDVDLNANRGLTLGGNGVEISVGPSSTLTFNGVIASEANLVPGYAANPAVGRIDKTGFGTLLITNANNTYNGLTEVKEGTLKWEPASSASATRTPFGSTNAFLDGTIVRSGATLALHPQTLANNSNATFTLQEWFTFEGGSILDVAPVNTVALPHDANITLNGVLQFNNIAGAPAVTNSTGITPLAAVPGFTVVNVARRAINFNNAGGYMTGDGSILKTGAGALALRENSPEWTGQILVNQGTVFLYGAGNVAGTGNAPIILGRNSFAEANGEFASSGTNAAQLIFIDEGGYRDVSDINQDIIIRDEGTLGGQTKLIGAQNLADVDVVNFNGTITLNDDLTIYNNDSARDSTAQTGGTSTANAQNTRNDTRSIGALTNSETYFINFNGNITGAAGNDITTSVTQSGSGNVANGSITGANDDLVQRAIFGLNGDNSGWSGDLIMGNTSSDVDTQHIVSVGNVLGLSANNNVTLRNNATLQTSGKDITIGSLLASGIGLLDNYIENASTIAGSITITQNTDATVEVVFRDGVNFFQLQAGETDAALSLVKKGGSVLTLVKGNTFTGTTTLDGGTLRLAYDADNSMLADGAALIMNDGILDLAGTVAHTEIVGSTTINGTVAIERSAGTSVIDLGLITRNAGSLRIQEDYIAKTDTLNTNGILGGWATVGGSFATNEFNAVDNFIIGLTTFDQTINRLGTGSQTIASVVTDNVNIVEAGTAVNPITMAATGTTTIYTLRQGADGSTIDGPNGQAVIDIGGGNILRIASGGVLLPDGSSSLVFTNTGILTAGAADNTAATLFLQSQDTDPNPLTSQVILIGTVIADNGTGVVDVRTTGPGITVFNGTNTYTGETLVGSGTLSIGDGGTTGTLGGSADVEVEASGILVFNRSDASLSVINSLTGSGTIVQYGPGTTTLNAASPLSSLDFVAADGTLATVVDNAINTSGNLVFGATYGATTGFGTVDLTNGSAMVGGLLVQTNSTLVNQLTIGSGKSLTVNGDVTIGVDIDNSTDTRFTVSGGGELIVNKESGTFQVGGGTGAVNGNRAIVDMSGLDTLTVDLGSGGVFRVGDMNANSASSGNAVTSMTLADTTVITTGTFGVGDNQGISNAVATLNLGSVSTVINADNVNVGDRFAQRGQGVLQFAESTGTLQIRGSDGVSRTNMSVINTGSGTGLSMTATVDLTGHSSDLLLNTLVIGSRTAGNGGATSTVSFDTGILDVSTIMLGHKLGGGGTSTIKGTLNIDGGTVAVGAGGISMGLNTGTNTASKAVGEVNLTGGTVTVAGDITRGGTTQVSQTSTATLLLDGASLDMQGNNIGDATNPVDLTAASGTLSNLGELNGGADLTKTTAGTLILEGDNNYTGNTVVSEGTLQLGSGGTTGTMNTVSSISVASGATFAVNQSDTVTQGSEFSTGAITGAGNFAQVGSGTTILTAANTYLGTTDVDSGVLYVDGNQSAATGNVTVASGATLGGDGIVGGNTTIELGGQVTAGTIGGVGQIDFAGDLTVSGGSTWLVDFVTGGVDLIDVAGNLTLGGMLSITDDLSWTEGNTYTIASYGNAGPFTERFSNALNNGDQVGNFYVNYADGGNFITLTAVPEPGTYGLLALAFGGLLLLRRRRNLVAMHQTQQG